jgi:class 3 adenylate cyclase
MEQPKRRLSAVWFADIVGYSELSRHDEPAALGLVDLLQSLCREIVSFHEGRVVKFIGDACLAEFASTDSAVRSAIALLERFIVQSKEHGQAGSLRIGVHLGEVTATTDGDLYGDGINTASRLQHTASPGQVIISEDVWRQLRQRPEFRFAPLGAVELRGITTQVQVYDVLFGSRAAVAPQPAATTSPGPETPAGRWKALAAFVALVVIGAAAWALTSVGSQSADSTLTPPSPLTVAIVPAPRPPAAPEKKETPTTKPEAPAPTAAAPTVAEPPAPRSGRAGRGAGSHPGEVRALLQRLADAVSSNAPRETFAALGPGTAAALTGRGAQLMKDNFKDGLTVRVGRIDPAGAPVDGKLPITFVLFAKSSTRPETPMMFNAVLERDAQGQLKFVELNRELPPGRRGR